ncbi:MAG: hypothetical protein QOC64_2489 [Solirubrobacteraceae bacterium]|jgi:predicted SnoaL-like aldol condensation-catalyzing enzyme|nr:hypothetical protein [Solirubrobacteraceae bacterium]
MSDAQRNKRLVIAFYTTAFNGRNPEDAVATYLGPTYVQHDPMTPDGPEAFIEIAKAFLAQYPEAHLDIRRAIADGNLVVTHSLLTTSPDDRGTAAADFFRVEEGRVVEHWAVLQPVPETSANAAGMV